MPAKLTVPSAFVVSEARGEEPPIAPPKAVAPEPLEFTVRLRAMPSELIVEPKVASWLLTVVSPPRTSAEAKVTSPEVEVKSASAVVEAVSL